jgi:hypothetical protein
METAVEPSETTECPFCLGQMRVEECEGKTWLVCPNSCPTEYEVVPRKPVATETDFADAPERERAAGA